MLSLINSRYFDENSTVGDNFYKDLNATQGDNELLNNYSSLYAGKTSRIGKTEFDNNEFRSGTSYTTSHIGLDAGENIDRVETLDDIDDFNGYEENLSYMNVNGKHPVIRASVFYIDDHTDYSGSDIAFTYDYTPANHTNLKLITITCKIGDSNITLRYPTANIGGSKFLSLEELSR